VQDNSPIDPLPALARAAVHRRRTERRSLRSLLFAAKLRSDITIQRLVAFFSNEDPIFATALLPALVVTAVLFVRSPLSNYIFDEQEALLANPYVNGKGLRWWQAFQRDFWGLPSDHSIGSYRPIPNVVWRALWPLGQSPWVLHWVNILVHAVVAALLASLTLAITKQRRQAWLTGAVYASLAILTEAVTGVVGLADVLAVLFVLLAVHALRKPVWLVMPAVFTSVLLGLFSKESAIVAVGLVPLTALVTGRTLDCPKPRILTRAVLSGIGAILALVLYTEARRRWFPFESGLDAELVKSARVPKAVRLFHSFLHWFHQPRLPADPMNNPLVLADFPHRLAGALRVYASGFLQLLFPLRLSGDYSFPAEPIPSRLIFGKSILGALLMIVPIAVGAAMWLISVIRDFRLKRILPQSAVSMSGNLRLCALGCLWLPLAYFPLSNIPIVLPTVRAERFWVLPALGCAVILGSALNRLICVENIQLRKPMIILAASWLAFQAMQARLHACDYADDLAFWQAAARAVPRSAKAHLNYAVMLGTRNRMTERLREGAIAQELAPEWPMAHVYQGDTLCRMKRYDEAFPHYARGFKVGPNEPNLIALGLQCLWDGKQISKHEDELLKLAGESSDRSWLNFLVVDIVNDGEKYNGVQPKYRPRGYNEGPKK
jgi:hypothetical protein